MMQWWIMVWGGRYYHFLDHIIWHSTFVIMITCNSDQNVSIEHDFFSNYCPRPQSYGIVSPLPIMFNIALRCYLVQIISSRGISMLTYKRMVDRIWRQILGSRTFKSCVYQRKFKRECKKFFYEYFKHWGQILLL